MESLTMPVQVRWSDLDPNFHLRHSVYYDWGALRRIQFFREMDLNTSLMGEMHFGPIIFREECIFRKEIRLDDTPSIDLKILKARKDYSRWTIRHTIFKNGDTVCAILTCEGAWMDTLQRKLIAPPEKAIHVFSQMPKDAEFAWEEGKTR
jgi:acyl-CoA thioester hydrolase